MDILQNFLISLDILRVFWLPIVQYKSLDNVFPVVPHLVISVPSAWILIDVTRTIFTKAMFA